MIMAVCNCSSLICQFSSPYGVGYTSTIRFNQTRVAHTGVVDTCLNNLTTILEMAATIWIGPEPPVSCRECETRFGLVEKGENFTRSRSVGALDGLNLSE